MLLHNLINIWESLRPATLFKKRLWQRCFPVNFAKFSRTPSFHGIPPVAAFECPGSVSDKTSVAPFWCSNPSVVSWSNWNCLLYSHIWWSWSKMQSTVTLLTIFSTYLRPFTLQVWAIYKFIRLLLILLQIQILLVSNKKIDILYNLNRHIQY